MKQEIDAIIARIKETYEGDPWFGRPVRAILEEVPPAMVFERFEGQHSLAELLWHTITWREFVISRLQPEAGKDGPYFERNDWRELGPEHSWEEGLRQLEETQARLLQLLEGQHDGILEQTVPDRAYNYRKLLAGITDHDIYHLGQIAHLSKGLSRKGA